MADKRDIKLKYYPSMSGFKLGEQVVTGYPGGCLRHILISAHGIRSDSIHPIYAQIGELNELRWQDELTADSSVTEVLREEPVKGPIVGSESVTYAGRADFIVTYEDGREEVHECKATVSKTARRDVMRKGKVKINHLAQLLSYMIQLELQDGKLVYGYYQYPWSENHDATELVCTESRVFTVRIEDDGRVIIDGHPSAYTVLDQLKHMQATVEVLTEKKVGDRPASEDAWSSPCRWCDFKNTCDKVDQSEEYTLEDLLLMAEEELNKVEQREPNIFRPVRRPKDDNA